jgi:hypothetical protein
MCLVRLCVCVSLRRPSCPGCDAPRLGPIPARWIARSFLWYCSRGVLLCISSGFLMTGLDCSKHFSRLPFRTRDREQCMHMRRRSLGCHRCGHYGFGALLSGVARSRLHVFGRHHHWHCVCSSRDWCTFAVDFGCARVYFGGVCVCLVCVRVGVRKWAHECASDVGVSAAIMSARASKSTPMGLSLYHSSSFPRVPVCCIAMSRRRFCVGRYLMSRCTKLIPHRTRVHLLGDEEHGPLSVPLHDQEVQVTTVSLFIAPLSLDMHAYTITLCGLVILCVLFRLFASLIWSDSTSTSDRPWFGNDAFG